MKTTKKLNVSHQVPIEVRFFDLDINNHVNNSVYLTYMENARTSVLQEDFLRYKKAGILFVVAEVNCKYRKAIFLNDPVSCKLSFELSGRAQFIIHYTFLNPTNEQVYALGHTKLAMINEQSQRPIAIPEELIQKFMDRH